MGVIRIGTSGWHYAHWRGTFYPADLPTSAWLAYYRERFDTVEINNSFYRLPSEATLALWRDAVPPGFTFAAKASRYLTHTKKLKDPEGPLHTLLPRLEVLGATLGPILFQLPPRWRCNLERLETFLAVLPATHRYAFEFRDPSWHVPAVYDLLRRHGMAFCAYDLSAFQAPLVVTADFAYVRLHGPGPGAYQGSYPQEQLAVWARRIRDWDRELAAVYVYFDNDERGFAVHDALRLRRLLAMAP